jgi:hypothetical protein
LEKNNLIVDGKLLHIRRCAHILNLIVKDGLDELKYVIENIRDIAAYWTAAPKRVEKFEEIAKHCKVKIEQKKIQLDCKTRWNSTFKMPSIALPYKVVFITASRVDRQYTCLPSEEEWEFATNVVERLRLFNDIAYQVRKNGSLLLMLWRGLGCSMTSLKYFLGLVM